MALRIKRIAKMAALLVGAVVGVAVLWLVGAMWLLSSTCGNDHERRLPSPDGQREVVVFRRDCGATTDFSTQISILDRGEKLPNEPGNLYRHRHEVPVSVAWQSPQELIIRYPGGYRGLYEAAHERGITVQYAEEPPVRSH